MDGRVAGAPVEPPLEVEQRTNDAEAERCPSTGAAIASTHVVGEACDHPMNRRRGHQWGVWCAMCGACCYRDPDALVRWHAPERFAIRTDKAIAAPKPSASLARDQARTIVARWGKFTDDEHRIGYLTNVILEGATGDARRREGGEQCSDSASVTSAVRLPYIPPTLRRIDAADVPENVRDELQRSVMAAVQAETEGRSESDARAIPNLAADAIAAIRGRPPQTAWTADDKQAREWADETGRDVMLIHEGGEFKAWVSPSKSARQEGEKNERS